METMQWKELPITNPQDGPGKVNSSAMCLVAYKERDFLNINCLSPIKWDLVTQEIGEEGVFVFGGVKGETPDNKIQDSKLYKLSIGVKTHTWSVV